MSIKLILAAALGQFVGGLIVVAGLCLCCFMGIEEIRTCEYCGKPLPESEIRMMSYSHGKCWKREMARVRGAGDHGKSYGQRANKYE